MRRTLVAALIASVVVLTVEAQEPDLSLRSKALTSAAASKSAQAPFTSAGRDPLPEMMLREELDLRGPHGACANAGRDVCYDLTEGRLDWRPAREYMPKIDGMRAESVSLRHNRIAFRYSFK